MKKRNTYIGIGILFLITGMACTQEKSLREEEGDTVKLESLGLELMAVDNDADVGGRAVTDYAVNTPDDPTYTLAGRESWELTVTIYDGITPYAYGESTFSWSAGTTWLPDDDIWFPNYTRQRVDALLQPQSWAGIALDQSTGNLLFAQDVLMQNGDPEIQNPAHILTIEMKHAFSMLDFRIIDVDLDHINVTVEAGGQTYVPYQVGSGTDLEYMVIVPVGTSQPVITISTNEGLTYVQTTVDEINSTAVNHCYCFLLGGLELELAEITVSEWTRGPGIAGEYTTEQSYPTFRGRASEIIALFYDNGQEQDIIFNDQGEATVRPAGRTIVAYRTSQSGATPVTLDPPIILSSMNIDLTGLF